MSKNYYIIPIFVPHEGCPHNCVFCNQDRITGVTEVVTAETVRGTINDYLETIKNKSATIEVSFFGGTFTGIREEKQRELLEVAKSFKDKKLIDKIRLSTRPDYIDEYILTYLKEYRVDIIELGVQSLDDEVLKKAGRGHSALDVIEASKLIKEYKFILGHQIMPGLPGDTFEKNISTTKASIEMKPDICRIYPSLVIKDTPMEQMYKSNDYVPYSLEEAVNISKVMYEMYRKNKINVIRIGLQPTESINEGKDIIAGPFHPSFRELVEGSLISDIILKNMNKEEVAVIHINSKDLSKLYANKKLYFNRLKEFNKIITVEQDDKIERGYIKLCLKDKKLDIIY
ncbi:oxygen-independent coproporphyrinogen-III oxidase-like protein HemZ [Clostridium puniceum]|uniref:Oxygen-independent coproporphyrinogen-III oxidase-like protein HemZ n=1 Tax=Clostridium puniceum TaxID=29367 RepID=A0A1S8T3D6_9CLOT|nr:radical SAM protein [Clostridium puniceum]OOM72280.1 oxygen-independent coproporphyrinogen-III oxidase-like protein HemZ [Clostridium puniceum]